MANWKLMAVAGLKRERAEVVASIQPELDRIDRLIEGLNGTPKEAKVKKAVGKGKSRSEAAKKMWETRRAKSKLDKEAHARTEARQSPGASLREAAAG